ncbi:MAG: hypothetical protein U0457_19155 [Candidatus Sericytochromatia bacterium]
MKRNITLTIISSALIFQSYSFANTKLQAKDIEFIKANIFSKENFSYCYQDQKTFNIKEDKLCGSLTQSYFPYLLNRAIQLLIEKDYKIDYNDPIYKHLEKLSGIKAFTKEYNEKEMVNYFNPKMIEWVFNNFYEKPDKTTLGIKNQEFYDYFLKKELREYTRAYIGLQKRGDFSKKVEEYKESLKKDPYSGTDFTANFAENIKLDIKSEPRDYEDYTIIGCWLRRGIDGTEKVAWKNLKILMEDYDSDWFKEIQKQ